ncbi:MAG: PTS sugar transporter subunit IIA [Anaerolineaceae bacterium]|jgi:PTS system galactitol-specific IIA component|nr:MAG: PTS sugar transporter subunit IIA [Anaerolineaceae bacterium]
MSQAILKLLEPRGVLLSADVADSIEIIRMLGAELYKTGYVKESFIEAAIDRESRLPTGLPLSGGFNAAIPHTDIEHVVKPGLGMATLKKPVAFRNMAIPSESVDVSLVFLLALEQPKAQIEMLQEIAGVLQAPDVVSALMKAKTYDDVVSALK